MSESKKPQEPNLIEDAIGKRAKEPTPEHLSQDNLKTVAKAVKKEMINRGAVEKIPEKSSPSKMSEQGKQELRNLPIPQDLEALNRETEERLLNNDPTFGQSPPTIKLELDPSGRILENVGEIPASKPDPQPVTETSTQESQPPQNDEKLDIDDKIIRAELPQAIHEAINMADTHDKHVRTYNKTVDKLGIPKIEKIDEYEDAEKGHQFELKEPITVGGCPLKVPAEDKDLVALKAYILDNGFVVATVAMHIRMLCTSAMTTPSTTDWDFADRANIPDLVFALLHQPGYLEGIWPSLKIVMSDNKANPAWTAGISMTIAFFDIIRTLPMLKELNNG